MLSWNFKKRGETKINFEDGEREKFPSLLLSGWQSLKEEKATQSNPTGRTGSEGTGGKTLPGSADRGQCSARSDRSSTSLLLFGNSLHFPMTTDSCLNMRFNRSGPVYLQVQ